MTPGVAVIQMSSTADVSKNLAQAEVLISSAAQQGAKLLFLPENFALLGVGNPYQAGLREALNKEPETLRKWLAAMARQHQVWLVAGSIPMANRPDGSLLDKRVRAVCLVFNERGEEVARYDKIHLFDVDVADEYGAYRESDTVESGDQLVVLDTPCGRLGLAICYDLRFAELFYQLRAQGAEMISVPSAFTATTGEAHWQVLLRARAIETQCYVLAPNQCGQHSEKRHSYGHSLIVDPWGEVVGSLADQPGVVCANIDLARVAELRQRMPVAQHHRLINRE